MKLFEIVYDAAVRLGAGAAVVASCFDNKTRRLVNGHRAVWKYLEDKIEPGARYVWIHAASLGEFEQGRPLMEAIKRGNPELRILLTFFSPSGYDVRKNWEGADLVCYLPFDTRRNARRFVELVRPEKVFFVKYEFWHNFLDAVVCSGAELYLISAVFRKDQIFFRRTGGQPRRWLHLFNRIFVQDEGSRRLLDGIGVRNVTVAGDTRFDRVADIRRAAVDVPVLDRFVGRPGSPVRPEMVFMAGSSWPADEAVYSAWLRERKDVKGVIAPHEFDSGRLSKLKALFDGEAVLKSEAEKDISLLDEARILIIDCFGILSSAYAYCDVAYVGGGFGAGLHNINEAAVFGVPVIYGPNNKKFIEARDMAVLGGGLPVGSREEFERKADRLLFDRKERSQRGHWSEEYISEHVGATRVICAESRVCL